MPDPANLRALNIGEIMVSAQPIVISTVLGSCVSVGLFSSAEGIGGLIHYALPHALRPLASEEEKLRYGEFAIPLLIESVRALSPNPALPLQAKLAGGGAVTDTSVDIGGANIEIARKILSQFRIPIVGEDVGGLQGRRLHFHTATGRLQVAPVNSRSFAG